MKKTILFVFAFVAFATVSFAQGVLKFKSEKHDFGKVEQGKPATFSFEFVNTGNQPVVISNAQASCGCTTPDWTKDPILPGKTGFVKATYNAAAVGPFNKTVTVYSNAETPTLVLNLTGEVAPAAPAGQPAVAATTAATPAPATTPVPVTEKKTKKSKKKNCVNC
jgi:hypothetical protein